ncbi:MAG TPA: DUF1592 domain-containing protein [Planctomycetota bacterium]|nr:DUF1592 domain-containing protein [Planctomycetota bacterium]
MMKAVKALLISMALLSCAAQASDKLHAYFSAHCMDCHDSESSKGGLDLSALKPDFDNTEAFAKWVKVQERIESGEMPPKKRKRPPANDTKAITEFLHKNLLKADLARVAKENRTSVRRLTRVEYENTIRDVFDMPGIAVQNMLPADGSAHGFDKNSDALDISHVNMARYVEVADHILDMAIATRPTAPSVQKRRISLCCNGGFVAHIVMNGDGVLLKNKKPDPEFPPAGEYKHIDEGAHARMDSFSADKTVGVFRHEDESVSPYFKDHVTIYPGFYRVRTSLWSFQWDKGQVLPARGTEAARLSVVQLTGDGRGGQHPSYVLGYYDAPSMDAKEHEITVWMNHNEMIGFNTASLAPVANYSRKGHAMAFTGPGIAVDWLDVEGPLYEIWPPRAHQVLFGSLPLVEFKPKDTPAIRPPPRRQIRQLGGLNRPDPIAGIWTVKSDQPLADADRLLGTFLPKLFRRPVEASVRAQYVAKVDERLKAGDCFESAMRWAFRAALCSPDFLYLLEPAGKLDDYALACRLSYFLWTSTPDAALTDLAAAVKLRKKDVLREQVERMLKDQKSNRFVEDFLGQWLKLRQIAATDPDRKLYPEFSPYLMDSMVAETRAYMRELIDSNLDATHLIRSDFAMLNEKLAKHYGIPGVSGSSIRKVTLPPQCERGGFLTQGSILKITANGTTTSPVPRGAFVLERLLGKPPDPPPPSVPAVEPDVRGAITIREQLEKHRSNAACASCHAKIDPPGFALESFDVIGGFRDRYRSIGAGDPAPRGSIDPIIGISFKLGPKVDASSELPDGRKFSGINEFKSLIAADPLPLLKNMAHHLAVYSAARELAYSDREPLDEIVRQAEKKGAGLRTLIHELVQSGLFQTP